MEAVKQYYYAAIYCRLSKEDGDKEESNSVTNQKSIISEFLKNCPDIEVVSIHIDDGFSGKNFDRPAFQKMMTEVQQGKVNCIIVKDLSRFSRNYIDAGQYLEYDFPQMGIRFIAVNDDVDTAYKNIQNNDILIPFKNLINNFYLEDISRKTRGSLEIKRKQGDFISAFAVYGYQKDTENKHKLVIDEYAANIVKEIFQLKLSGKSSSAIANTLNEKGVLSPLEYKNSLGIKTNCNWKKFNTAKWYPQTVDSILKNEIYTGVLEQGKTTTINYKLKKQIKKDKCKWIRKEGTHCSIVPKWLFNRVNTIMQADTRTAPGSDDVYLLSGLLYCVDCNYNLIRSTIKKGEKVYIYYICSNYKKNNICTSHRINENKLKLCIMQIIEKLIDLKEIVSTLNAKELNLLEMKNNNHKILVTKAKQELDSYKKKLKLLSEKLLFGIIDETDYFILKKNYNIKINKAKEIILKSEKETNDYSKSNKDTYVCMDNFCNEKNFLTFDRAFFVTFVDKILVYEGNKIKVKFTFEDQYHKVFGVMESTYPVLCSENSKIDI